MKYQDFKPVNPVNPVDMSLVDPQIRQDTNGIRHKSTGFDVRELISRAIEWNSMTTNNYSAKVFEALHLLDYLQNELDNTLHDLTQDSEVINAREDASGHFYVTLKKRLDAEQIARGHLGIVAGTDDSEHTLIVKGLTENSKGMHYKTISTNQKQKVHGGVYTKHVSQIGYKEAQHD